MSVEDDAKKLTDELLDMLESSDKPVEGPEDFIGTGELLGLVEKLKVENPELLQRAGKILEEEKKQRPVVSYGICGLCLISFPRKTSAQRFCTPDHKLLAHYERRLIEMGRVKRLEGHSDPYGPAGNR